MQVRYEYNKALAHCHKHSRSAKKAISVLNIALVKRGSLQNFLNKGLRGMPKDQPAILTMGEEMQLANTHILGVCTCSSRTAVPQAPGRAP